MKVLFTHGARFYKFNNDYYTVNLSNEIWKNRYASCFDKVLVMGRYTENITQEKAERLVKASCDEVEFNCIPYEDLVLGYFVHHKEFIHIIESNILQCDLIIIRMPYMLANAVVKLCKKLKKPYLIEVVGCAWDGLWNHGFKGKLIALPIYLQMKKIVKSAPYAIYVTNGFLQRRYPCNGKTISASNVMIHKVDDEILSRRLHHIENKKNDKTIIGTTAAVDLKYKGQCNVIYAIAKLKKEGRKNFEYQLVGGGDQTRLKNIAQKYEVMDCIKFIGTLQKDDVLKWLDTIDIYIQPSFQEGLPRALIEAMSRGVPSIASDVGGNPELLNKDFIFRRNNNVVNQICNLITKFNKSIMLNEATRNFHEAQNYSYEVIEDRRSKFFLSIRGQIGK